MKSVFTIAFLGYLLFVNVSDKKSILDSLWGGKNVHDTLKIKDILDYGIQIQKQSLDSALFFYNWALSFADESLEKSDLNPKTIEKLSIAKSTALRCIGIVYYYQGRYDRAIMNYLESLKIAEEFGDKNSMAACYNNIGMIYSFQGIYKPAIEYYQKTLEIKLELNDLVGIAACYTNIGIVHYYLGNQYRSGGDEKNAILSYGNAKEYYFKSLSIWKDLNDLKWMSACYNNIGLIFKELLQYDQAIDYYLMSLRIKEQTRDNHGMLSSLINISELNIILADSSKDDLYQKNKYLKSAIEYGTKAFDMSREINIIPRENEAAKALMNAYAMFGDHEKGFEFAQIYISTKDTLFSNEKTKAIAEMQTKYEIEKKQQEIEKQKLVIEKHEIDNKRQRNQRNFFIVGSILLAMLVAVIARSYRHKSRTTAIISEKNNQLEQAFEEIKVTSEALAKQNEKLNQQYEEITKQHNEIESQRNSLANLAWDLQEKSEEVEKQKNILSVQNKEITDSIIYAQRIQSAVLPSTDYLSKLFREHFILYKPKSIVSGDFYWATRLGELLIFCVTDCTGHGVPGAFMSMLGVSFLNEIVRKEGITNAAQILDQLRDHVVASMVEREGNYVKLDGMDMGLCVLNKKNRLLQFSGANIPCWIATSRFEKKAINDKIELKNGLVELKPDRMPIARFERMDPFSMVEYKLKKGDIIYISSDGFADQFGGTGGKKFQKNILMGLLAQNKNLLLSEQNQILDNSFEEWKKNRNQLDDVTLLGVKV